MAHLSEEMQRLRNKWKLGNSWPKWLEWVRIDGLRGFTGQRIDFNFPIVAIVGENGSGKSTILQSLASVYTSEELPYSPADFFIDTRWEEINNAEIKYSFRQGVNEQSETKSIRKPTERWRYPSRPERYVIYKDLSRIQPVATRIGYGRIAAAKAEVRKDEFDEEHLKRFSVIMGRDYKFARMVLTDAHGQFRMPVVGIHGKEISGFHQGMGETATQELIGIPTRKYGLIIIDEIETSLHPKAQRKTIRDLAKLASDLELQIVLTTHSPYVLEEIPEEGRICILRDVNGERKIMREISPEFAMTKMDDVAHPECDIYVEDFVARDLLREILSTQSTHVLPRCEITPCGPASVGIQLGQMITRFKRPTCVFLDGDIPASPGCHLLPGNMAPEKVVFGQLLAKQWPEVALRLGREQVDVIDACQRVITDVRNHHEWPRAAASALGVGSDHLWQTLCSCWVKHCLKKDEADAVVRPIELMLGSRPSSSPIGELPLS